MTAAIHCLAAERAKRLAPASEPLILGRPPLWWGRELLKLGVLIALVAPLIWWVW